MTLQQRMKYTRAIYGVSQTEVGNGLGTTKQYINQIENNKLNASDERLEQVINLIYRLGEAKKEGRLKEVMEDLKELNKK